uniref:Putative ovule protein n=1 Tax=Solanum chacoense TaxID=4108 RepID=A0A0V0I5L7_SOLCH
MSSCLCMLYSFLLADDPNLANSTSQREVGCVSIAPLPLLVLNQIKSKPLGRSYSSISLYRKNCLIKLLWSSFSRGHSQSIIMKSIINQHYSFLIVLSLSIQITARCLDIIGCNFSSVVVSQYCKLYGPLRE